VHVQFTSSAAAENQLKIKTAVVPESFAMSSKTDDCTNQILKKFQRKSRSVLAFLGMDPNWK